MMFQHVFAEMNEMLDEITRKYPLAGNAQKQELAKKWSLLQHMSDGIIEEWLCFEEKMGGLRHAFGSLESRELPDLPELEDPTFVKGQGYYKLLMFAQAVAQFERVIQQFPDSVLARTYLGMCHLHLEQSDKAAKHFWLVLEKAGNKRLRSVIYNALGCIEAQKGVYPKAKEYFKLAHHSDPSLPEPLANLEACTHSTGKLHYGPELTSLL
ncbi:tetratricopeptide repeat protein [Paenibacillus phocaensis]|uniref:tetratricopeptide repeat protein n=1 Tax=Paenibacillus phocaensis TaxID=1776378 RepID=UPI0038CD8149